MLQNLGPPGGDYNNDILCMYMTDETSGNRTESLKVVLGDYVDDDGFKLEAGTIDEELSAICVDTLGADPYSIFGNANVTFTGDPIRNMNYVPQNGKS